MSISSMGAVIAGIAVFMSWLAVNKKDMLVCFGASVMWASLSVYILTNTMAGQTWQIAWLSATVVFGIAMLVIGIFSKQNIDMSDNIRIWMREKTVGNSVARQRARRQARRTLYEERADRAIHNR